MQEKIKRILVLGGTTEASSLVRNLKDVKPIHLIYSLAGITKTPIVPEDVQVRIGGFGGIEGLVSWLKIHQISTIIDATHPFAMQMTRHAWQAAQQEAISYLRIDRPAWFPQQGDLWQEVSDMTAAVAALGEYPLRVFLTIGRKDLLPFKQSSVLHDYWIRSVDSPSKEFLPINAQTIQARGPFTESDEYRFLQENRIMRIVTKNSGGSATIAKLLAANRLHIPVIMVQRSLSPPQLPTVSDWQGAKAWICDHLSS